MNKKNILILLIVLMSTILTTPIFANVVDSSINEKLFEAVKSDNVNVVKELLEQGADPNYRFNNRVPILNVVRSHEVNRLLLNAGANPNASYSATYYDSKAKKTSEGIEYLIYNRILAINYEAIKDYIEHGADLDVKNYNNITPLQFAQYIATFERVKADPVDYAEIQKIISLIKEKSLPVATNTEKEYIAEVSTLLNKLLQYNNNLQKAVSNKSIDEVLVQTQNIYNVCLKAKELKSPDIKFNVYHRYLQNALTDYSNAHLYFASYKSTDKLTEFYRAIDKITSADQNLIKANSELEKILSRK